MKITIIAAIYILNNEMVSVTKDMINDINRTRPKDSEFIIVDNCSTHGINEMIEGADIYVRLPTNRGWGGGHNVGMQLASGEYFVLVNNDITISKSGWAEQLVGCFESKPKIGAISAKDDRYGFTCAFFAIRREIYEKIGGFDEKNFPLGVGQDTDYLYRLTAGGWEHHILTIDGFYHLIGRTYNQKEFKEVYYQDANYTQGNFIKKWGFTESEWEKRGHVDWRRRIEKDSSLDRYNELKL